LGLGEDELIVAREQLDELRDQVFVMCAAVDDARQAAPALLDLAEAREWIDWIVQAAAPLLAPPPRTP